MMSSFDVYPLQLSILVATVATVVSFTLGVPLAWLLARRRFPGRSVLEVLVLLPMVLPPTVIGYYLLLAVGRRSAIGAAIESLVGSPIVFTPAAAVLATIVAAAPPAEDPDNAGVRREPELPEHEEVVLEPRNPAQEFELVEDESQDASRDLQAVQRRTRRLARQVALDPGDGLDL